MKRRITIGRALIGMVLVSVLSLLSYNRLYKHQAPYLDYVATLQEEGRSVCLDAGLSPSAFSAMLRNNGYCLDSADAQAIAGHLIDRLQSRGGKSLHSLSELNMTDFRLSCDYIEDCGCKELLSRLQESREKLGLNESFEQWWRQGMPDGIYRESDSASSVLAVAVLEGRTPVQGIPVRLKRHYYKETARSDDAQPPVTASDSVLAFALTGPDGKAVFEVNPGYYSLIPVQDGYEFGASKGSVRGMIGPGEHEYSFQRKTHTINAFSPSLFKRIKKEDAITVRTPESYRRCLALCLGVLLLGWWLSFILNGIVTRKRGDGRGLTLFPIVMFLNILGVLSLFGIYNPLMDNLFGAEMTLASLLGLLVLNLFSFLRVAKLYASGVSLFGKRIPFEPIPRTMKGTSFLLLSLALMLLLAFFGSAPDGSDAKIYLFFLQPAELCKFLTVVFMAAFFAEKAPAIQAFSQSANPIAFRLQLRTISGVIAVIFLICFLYMGILSDMGPALVLITTFIFMYSLARRDFFQLLLGVSTFLLVCHLAGSLWGHGGAVIVAGLLWLAGWILYGFLSKRTIYESALFLNLLISLLVLGGPVLDTLGFRHQAERLETRLAMTGEGVWENDATIGGDQVAQSIWGYASGGFSGQGLGRGNANLIPTSHTDLILSSIGEQLGLLGLLAIILCMGLLLLRCFQVGKKAGNPFSFYLASGIGMVTAVQFMIIALGSVGIIPLTGVAVPFLSYAKTSIVCNLAAIGLILAISKESAGRYQAASIKPYETTLKSGLMTFSALSLLLVFGLFHFMVSDRDRTILRAGLYTNPQGISAHHYNPRIKALEDKMTLAPVYDRNGLLLATGSREELMVGKADLLAAGADPEDIQQALLKGGNRYYPFGMQTFFMVGDYNERVQWNITANDPRGFNAESRYLSRLRGFDNQRRDGNGNPQTEGIRQSLFKPDRFLPAIRYNGQRREMVYDYSELLPLLKEGVAGRREIKQFDNGNAQPLQLTLDAALQTKLQNRMDEYIHSQASLNSLSKLRASVVIMDVQDGDMLCSANYPLPSLSVLDSLEKGNIFVYNEKDQDAESYTDRDLGLTFQTHPGSTAKVMTAMAGLRKLGKGAAVSYDIDRYEIIENGRVKEPFSTFDRKRVRPAVGLQEAIVLSSNCYFINLLADKDLYEDLAVIYGKTGVRVEGQDEDGAPLTREEAMSRLREKGVSNYRDYRQSRGKQAWVKMNRYRGSADYWGIAYGQGPLYASPLNMAQVGAAVLNDGTWVQPRYLLSDPVVSETLVDKGTASLKAAMSQEADKHRRSGVNLPAADALVELFSKTGTPERTLLQEAPDGRLVETKPNDGWYLCVVRSKESGRALSIAVRLERLGSLGSKTAVRFMADVVLPTLSDCGYINY